MGAAADEWATVGVLLLVVAVVAAFTRLGSGEPDIAAVPAGEARAEGESPPTKDDGVPARSVRGPVSAGRFWFEPHPLCTHLQRQAWYSPAASDKSASGPF